MRFLAVLFLFIPIDLFAGPLYEFSQGGVRIVVYEEKCKLEAVKNLPLRAVWQENGKEIEGCIGARDELGVAVAYFEDRTIVALPMQVFRRVIGV